MSQAASILIIPPQAFQIDTIPRLLRSCPVMEMGLRIRVLRELPRLSTENGPTAQTMKVPTKAMQ